VKLRVGPSGSWVGGSRGTFRELRGVIGLGLEWSCEGIRGTSRLLEGCGRRSDFRYLLRIQ